MEKGNHGYRISGYRGTPVHASYMLSLRPGEGLPDMIVSLRWSEKWGHCFWTSCGDREAELPISKCAPAMNSQSGLR